MKLDEKERGTLNDVDLFKATLTQTIAAFQANPFNFLYEEDIRAYIFGRMFDAFSDSPVSIGGGFHVGANREAYGGGTSISTVPVKCEYPGERFDLAIIARDQVQGFDRELSKKEGWKNDPFWRQPVRVALEIKYFQLCDVASDKSYKFHKDIKKLQIYCQNQERLKRPFLGIAALFVQSRALPALSRSSAFGLLTHVETVHSEGVYAKLVSPNHVACYACPIA